MPRPFALCAVRLHPKAASLLLRGHKWFPHRYRFESRTQDAGSVRRSSWYLDAYLGVAKGYRDVPTVDARERNVTT